MKNKTIAIVHPYISFGGGAEGVCIAIIEDIVAAGHNVVIFTAEPPSSSIMALKNHLLEVDFGQITVVQTLTSRLRPVMGGKPPVLLNYSLLLRELKVRRSCAEADLVISTVGECDLAAGDKQICYIHYPVFPAIVRSDQLGGRLAGRARLRAAYGRVCRWISGYKGVPSGTTVVANSKWTAELTETEVSVKPVAVLHPPVVAFSSTSNLSAEGKIGDRLRVMSLGRLVPYKGYDMVIRALDRVSALTGIPSEIVFVGRGDAASEAELIAKSTDRVAVLVERNAGRATVAEVIERSSLGISAFKFEHFGMATAEMMASGLPVLVPNSGGQTEISADPDFVYSDEDELSRKLVLCVQNDAWFQSLQAKCVDGSGRFTREKFRQNFQGLLDKKLAELG